MLLEVCATASQKQRRPPCVGTADAGRPRRSRVGRRMALGVGGLSRLRRSVGDDSRPRRYAICLIAPAVLLAARAAAVWWAGAGRMKMPAAVLACLLAWLILADFQQHYFAFIERTGGQAHPTFRTAAVEPKLAALDYVLHRRAAGVAWIAADSWWSYQPLEYFSLGNRDVRIVAFKGGRGARVCEGRQRTAARGASNSATRSTGKSDWTRRSSGMGRPCGFSTSAAGPWCRCFAFRARSRE